MNYVEVKYPPHLGLVFQDREAGCKIFEEWQFQYGQIDEDEKIRVVVRGINRKHPHAYSVVISANMDSAENDIAVFTHISRIQRMNAASSKNLDGFIKAYREADAFFLIPAFARAGWDGSSSPDYDSNLRILIHRFHVRDAWEIGPNDPDGAAIHEDDDPIIPASVTDPPVKWWLDRRKMQ